ncbi:hypothetical protein NPIL_341241 [Nephila pilipes]|uniref:Uncharacterized protein n=1 Tax=Nephila pilipes TaxID=299642 RepID=A0A8X6J982_NEPPI|nr:hypothetical protein NPIL_341241 [Nephila pilipes]
MESLKENLKESVVKTEKEAFEDEIFRIVPTRYKEKAKNIFQFLKLQESFSWNSDGEIIYKNTVIPGSNIAFLVNDFLRNRKSAPEGRYVFLRALNDVNLPKHLDLWLCLYHGKSFILLAATGIAVAAVPWQKRHTIAFRFASCTAAAARHLALHTARETRAATKPPPGATTLGW